MLTMWKLPVPSTALLHGGPKFEQRLGREVAITFSYEAGESSEDENHTELVFEGTEAYKVTYYRACSNWTLEAYDRLVDCGSTSWLGELTENLQRNGGDVQGLAHLAINFDDGPCYEVVCRSYRIESEQKKD